MTIQQFIEKAEAGGFSCMPFLSDGGITVSNALFLEVEAWKAVGKVEGWNLGAHRVGADITPRWKKYMHRMIDALAEGKTIEQYLETL